MGTEITPAPCENCTGETTAHLVHASCLRLASTKIPHMSVKLLCAMARKLRPLISWSPAAEMVLDLTHQPKHLRVSNDSVDISQETGLWQLLRAIRHNLPAEIERLICGYLQPSFVGSLLACLDVVDMADWQGLRSATQPEYGHGRFALPRAGKYPSTLSGKMVDIMGEKCLSSIGTGDEADVKIELDTTQPINRVEYVIGNHGVVGLKVEYLDLSLSATLGQSHSLRPGFRTTDLHIQNLRDLVFWSDVGSIPLSYEYPSLLDPAEKGY